MAPVMQALLDRRGRSRLIFHDNKEELVERLSGYGIPKDIVPTTMGGNFEMNPNEWIENQRSIEMEEIA